MSVAITNLNRQTKALTACLPMTFSATVLGYVPPFQYDLNYQWSLSEDGVTYSVVQNFCLDNTVQFTTMRAGRHHLRCEVRLVYKRVPGPTPYVLASPLHVLPSSQVLFRATAELSVGHLGVQAAPCAVPLGSSTAPVYRIPRLDAPGARVRIMFQLSLIHI